MCMSLSAPAPESDQNYTCQPQDDLVEWYNAQLKQDRKHSKLVIAVAVVSDLFVPTLIAIAMLAYTTEQDRKRLRAARAVS